MKISEKTRKNFISGKFFLIAFGGFSLFFSIYQNAGKDKSSAEFTAAFTPKVSAAGQSIENALFTRQEFFGAEAIIALPTAEARENIAKLAENQPDNPEILRTLAALETKLSRFAEAEKTLIRLAEIDFSTNEHLADFYMQRGAYEKQAEILRKILFSADAEKRVAAFENLIYTAKSHDLKQYLQPVFYSEVIKESPNFYPIFEKLIENLTETEDYEAALQFIHQAKSRFPENKTTLLDREVNILLSMNRNEEAEEVYRAAFDPFWTEIETKKFYSFLSNQDRLRAYGSEIRNRFKNNPADFDAAIRLAHYQNNDYEYGNDLILPVILKLEQSKKDWKTEEIMTVTRLLFRHDEGETASRFLYTLYLREDFKKDSRLRAKILYQLFAMFSDAENQRLPLTRSDLRFYEDIARADTNPGITTGILSLLFSDTNPRRKLENQEESAMKFFNRAAAYRIFEEYKNENPNSPELAQMYLDIIRLYTATKEIEIAEKTLDEFSQKYQNAKDFPAVALKLADAFAAAKKSEKEWEIYQKILDYLGKSNRFRAPEKIKTGENPVEFEQNFYQPPAAEKPLERNEGINIPASEKDSEDHSKTEFRSGFRDFPGEYPAEITYSEILEKYISSLAENNKTAEIFALYSNELGKYPNEEWLYEKFLEWLENTNLASEKLKVYKAALSRFQSRGWQDKLARFFIRENRDAELKNFSEELIAKLSDKEIAEYLSQTVEPGVSSVFEQKLILVLYKSAHERFPRNADFVKGLLRYYKTRKQLHEWRKLACEYYFESPEIRREFLRDLAEKNDLRAFLQQAQAKNSLIYALFRADASAHLSDFENAALAYRKLNNLYPNTPDFSSRLISFTRSFGQKNVMNLAESANLVKSEAEHLLHRADLRIKSGEIFAELGDYKTAREEWAKLILTGKGDKSNYLQTATLYWDYFQYDDARQIIETARKKFADDSIYAFETGVIFEAQNKEKQAFIEYMKALESSDYRQKENARKRLTNLFNRAWQRQEKENTEKFSFLEKLDSAFETAASSKNESFSGLGFTEFLLKIKETEKAEKILNRVVSQIIEPKILESALEICRTESFENGERIVLKKLSETTKSPRSKISYALRLAENFETANEREAAKTVLAKLVREFPTNYGVLMETSDIYDRLGFAGEGLQILRKALPKSVGAYKASLSQKLAGQLIKREKLAAADQILSRLHIENPANIELFRVLAQVCVRRKDAEKLRAVFAETLTALKRTNTEKRESDEQIAQLRVSLIEAFTRLGDHKSAVEQHIEIINRDPDDEELTDGAIRYVKRYGGAETLLNYYQKLSLEAFKDHRWSVVLAKIYEADNNFDQAVENYENALINSPEMPELYLAIASLETNRKNYDAALKNLDEVLKITQNAPQYVKKKIEILRTAGRFAEIEIEEAKLPAEIAPEIKAGQFAEAAKLKESERDKARAIYRRAFAELLENPLQNALKSEDLTAYVEISRDEESLAEINKNLWSLREKLLRITEIENSVDSGEARQRISMLDAVLISTVGNIVKTIATDEELRGIHEDLAKKIENNSVGNEQQSKTLSVILDFSNRAGFGDLEERILLQNVKTAVNFDEKEFRLQRLLGFYNVRGAYQKSFEALENFGYAGDALWAETARLVGNKEKELEALRRIYWKPGEIGIQNDKNVARFLEILRAENRAELRSLTEKSSAHQLQLINFLIELNEKDLAHRAISNAALPAAWKASRNAESSLFLREIDENAACYFCAALRFDAIGNLLDQTPDKKSFLVGDDWFRLTYGFGEWLFEKEKRQTGELREADKYLAALTENYPQNSVKQLNLGKFYLENNQPEKAARHFRLAEELLADTETQAYLCAALYQNNQAGEAENLRAGILKAANLQNTLLFFQILQKQSLNRQAREVLPEKLSGFLSISDAETSADFQILIRNISDSFDDEKEKAAYFMQIIKMRPANISLAEMLVSENLIAKDLQSDFYELLLNRNNDLPDYDYSYEQIFKRFWRNTPEAESVYEQENDYDVETAENKRFMLQKQYLDLLISIKENVEAEKLISQIQKEIEGRRASPEWLKTAQIRLLIRRGKYDSSAAERFIGIAVSDAASKINAPNIGRLNQVLEVLKDENYEPPIRNLSEAFFARMFALEQFSSANFSGLARVYFQNNETAKGLHILQLYIDANQENKREEALAEISTLEIVKTRKPEAVKISAKYEEISTNLGESLRNAAEITAEFNLPDFSIDFRRKLSELDANDFQNNLKLAGLSLQKGEKENFTRILNELIANRNTPRAVRWQARLFLAETGESVEFPDNKFDAFSQLYKGISAEKSGQSEAAANFFLNSLFADKDQETVALHNLIRFFAATGKDFAALKMATLSQTNKSDDLLEILSRAAINTGDFQKAIEFERAKTDGGNARKILFWQKTIAEKMLRENEFTIDSENTRKL